MVAVLKVLGKHTVHKDIHMTKKIPMLSQMVVGEGVESVEK